MLEILLAPTFALKMAAPMTVVVPGQRIGKSDETHLCGPGTYSRHGHIYSSLTGFVQTVNKTDSDKIHYSVLTQKLQSVVPSTGSTVSARVTNVNPRFCKCSILSVDGVSLQETFRGMIRREDIRATEKDKIDVYRSFRPGDLILARVLPLGDASSYSLTTAENELGVVIATSEAGVSMVPISWCEMQCPKTLAKEHRKVAKVQPEYLHVGGS